MNFAKLPKYHIGKFPSYTVYLQYLLIKAATLVFYTKYSKTKWTYRILGQNEHTEYCL